jgi:hypothetical protein
VNGEGQKAEGKRKKGIVVKHGNFDFSSACSGGAELHSFSDFNNNRKEVKIWKFQQV